MDVAGEDRRRDGVCYSVGQNWDFAEIESPLPRGLSSEEWCAKRSGDRKYPTLDRISLAQYLTVVRLNSFGRTRQHHSFTRFTFLKKEPRADWRHELAALFLWKLTSEVLPSLWVGTSTPLIATHRHSTAMKVKYREAKSTGLRMLSRFSAMNRAPIFCQNTGACGFRGGFLGRMNAGQTIRDAILLARMRYWRLRGKHGPIGNCPKWRGRKNYLFLIRKHKTLANLHGYRETDVY